MSRAARVPLFSLLLAGAFVAPAAAAPGQRVLRAPQYRELQKRVARGWNTWNTTSVLSHAHLPEGFAITLGLKNSGTGLPYQRDFFQANPTLKRNERIRLGPHADDGSLGREGRHLPQPPPRHRRGEPEALSHPLLPAHREGPDARAGRAHGARALLQPRPSSTASG